MPLSVTDLNINIVLKVIWASFIKIDKLIYTTTEAKKSMFLEISFIKSDISFAKDG